VTSSLSCLFGCDEKQKRWDVKKYAYGKVQDMHARYNLCYADVAQEPDYEKKKGRIYSFADLSCLDQLRSEIPNFVGSLSY